MKRVRILRDGPIGDPGNTRASVVHAKEGEIIELSDTSADMAVNVSDPPRAEYIDDKPESEPESEDESEDEPESGDDGDGDDESGSGDDSGGKRSLLDRITGKGEGESSVLE